MKKIIKISLFALLILIPLHPILAYFVICPTNPARLCNKNSNGIITPFDKKDNAGLVPASSTIPIATSTTSILKITSLITSTTSVNNSSSTSSVTPVNISSPLTAVSPSFDTNLFYGSHGDKVKYLQDFLHDQGFYQMSIDGWFGLGTLRAVEAFQTANGLTSDGYFGKNSRATANAILQTILTPSKQAQQSGE